MRLSEVLESIQLPPDIEWYTPPGFYNGQIIFPVYGPSGGLSTTNVAYLVKEHVYEGMDLGTKGLSYGTYAVQIHLKDSAEELTAKVMAGIEALNAVR